MDECVKALEEKGFVNYFGPQRFGYPRGVMSSHIGLAMLQGNHVREIEIVSDVMCVCVCVCVCV